MSLFSGLFNWFFEGIGDGFHWMIYKMDVTQWGIVACLFVVSGFMALKTKI